MLYPTWIWSTRHCGLGRKWLVDFNAGKTQLVLFDRSNSTGAIDVKMAGSGLEKKSSFKMLGWIFSSKLDWGSYIISIAKSASKKIGALICSMSFFFLRLLFLSINLSYAHAWNTVVTSGLVPVVVTWNWLISYKHKYAGLSVLHFLPLLSWLHLRLKLATFRQCA